MLSLEDLIRSSSRALVIGVGGGGDVVGALATARFLEFCGLRFTLGGLSWERPTIDPLPGPRSVREVQDVHPLHEYAWLANPLSRTLAGARFAESRVAEIIGQEVLLVDISGGVRGVVAAIRTAVDVFKADLLVGIDVGGDSLAQGDEPGLYSPLADSIMLAAYAELEELGFRTIWGVFGFGSDGELTVEEIEHSLSQVARAGGFLGAWALTNKVTLELEQLIQSVPTEASAIPVECVRGAWGERRIRQETLCVKLTPLSALTFYLSPTVVLGSLSMPARSVRGSSSLEEANEALHSIGLRTELDLERAEYQDRKSSPFDG
jgi:hypothetical protein